MAAIVSKLDSYLRTLEEMYENISSDEEETGSRSEKEYFRVESDESGKSIPRPGKTRPIRRGGGGESRTEMPEQSDFDMEENYSSMDEKQSGEPLKKIKKVKKEEKEEMTEQDYGVIPDDAKGGGDRNYGEIPSVDKDYGELPPDAGQNYASLKQPKPTNLL